MRRLISVTAIVLAVGLVARAEDKVPTEGGLPEGAVARLGATGGHHGLVGHAALSADGALLATHGKDNVLLVQETATGREVARIALPFDEHDRSLAFSPDAKLLGVASASGVKLWDAASGRAEKELHAKALAHGASAFAFSSDGKRVLAADNEHLVDLDATTGAVLTEAGVKLKGVNALAVSPDGKTAALADGDGQVVVVDLASGKSAAVTEHKGASTRGALAFSPDGKRLALTTQRGLDVYDLGEAPKESFSVRSGTGIGPPVWVAEGNEIVTVDTSARTFRFDAVKKAQVGETVKNQPLHDLLGEVGTCAALARDGKTFAIGCNGAAVLSFDGPKLLRHLPSLQPVHHLAFSPDGKSLAEARSAEVGLWSLEKGALVWHGVSQDKSQPFLVAIGFAGDGSVLALNSTGTLNQFDATGKLTRIEPPLEGGIGGGAFSADAKHFLTTTISQPGVTDGPGDFYLFRVGDEAAKAKETFKSKEAVVAVALSEDGKLAVSGRADGEVAVHDVAKPQKAVRTFKAGKGAVTALALSPDARLVAVGTDKTASVFDTADGKLAAGLGEGDVTRILFSRDGHRVVTACQDGKVRVFDAADGKLEKTFEGHSGPLADLALSPDGKTLASGGQDGAIVLWSLTTP